MSVSSEDGRQAPKQVPAERTALEVAAALVEGFDNHYRLYRQISRAAKNRFEAADWQAVREAHGARIRFYDDRVQETMDRLHGSFDITGLPEALWQDIKLRFVGMLTGHKQPELAETFFNTVICKILQRTYYHNDYIFVRPAVSTEYIESDPPAYRSYYPLKSGLRECLRQVLTDMALRLPFEDLHRDLRYVLRGLRGHLHRPMRLEANHQIQVLSSLFFRNKRAYLLGKVINGSLEQGFAIPIVHARETRTLCLDAVLLGAREIAPLFAFNRAYLMVDMEVPSAYVRFLAGMLPGKPKAELYTSLGLQKHGKTLFYRDFLYHLSHSTDDFILAAGIRGLVMIVFTLPSYPYVFKVIRDTIAPQKNIDRETVQEKYMLVKRHDRVGRMADTLEYKDVAFPRSRFTAALLEELRREAPSMIEEDAERVVIRHLYIERRMTPLNIYIDQSDPGQVAAAVREYGNAIKELASVNIFPGDMLFKNFGVTRGGRVVFYDYDEITYMTETNFLHIPTARTPEDEMSAEPWYRVAPNDVFPEEFGHFLLSNRQVRQTFLEHHGDLLGPDYWNEAKRRVTQGLVADVFPYPEDVRFVARFRGQEPAPAREED